MASAHHPPQAWSDSIGADISWISPMCPSVGLQPLQTPVFWPWALLALITTLQF